MAFRSEAIGRELKQASLLAYKCLFFLHNFIILSWMGNFTVRIFAQPNFENVTGIGLHTSFEELNDTIILSVISQFSEKYFRLNKLCKMSSEYVEIKYISCTTVLIQYWFSWKFIQLFVPENFSMIILSYPFSKLLFSPTPPSRNQLAYKDWWTCRT